MTKYVPRKLKASELVDRLLVATDSLIPDELELKRIEHEARRSLEQSGTAKALGYFALGVLAAMRLKVDDIDRYFNAALQVCEPRDCLFFRLNYAIALQRALEFRRSADVAASLALDHLDDIEALRQAVRSAELACRFSDVDKFKEKLDRLGTPFKADSGEDPIDLQPVRERMQAYGVKESDLLERLEVAADVLRRKGHGFRALVMYTTGTGETMYQFAVPVTPEEAANLSFEVADAIVGAFDEPLSDLIVVSVTSFGM